MHQLWLWETAKQKLQAISKPSDGYHRCHAFKQGIFYQDVFATCSSPWKSCAADLIIGKKKKIPVHHGEPEEECRNALSGTETQDRWERSTVRSFYLPWKSITGIFRTTLADSSTMLYHLHMVLSADQITSEGRSHPALLVLPFPSYEADKQQTTTETRIKKAKIRWGTHNTCSTFKY